MTKELQVTELTNSSLTILGDQFFKESNLPGKFEAHIFVDTWTKIMNLGLGKIWANFQEDMITGAIGGLVHPDPYDGRIVVQEAFWFVHEDYRGGLTAIRLYRELENWARHSGASRMVMSCTLNKYVAKLRHLYESLGYRPVDISYFKDL
jgi:GNAT superfamily N-acetyltransferase